MEQRTKKVTERRPEGHGEKVRGTEEMERRENERLAVRQFNRPKIVSKSNSFKVMNLSKSGCALESHQFMGEQESRVVFDLPLPSRADSVTLAAKIVWEERSEDRTGLPRFRYGLCFEEMDSVSRSILDAYLDFLKRDVHIVKLEEAWGKLKEVQEKIEILVAFEERKDTPFLH